MRARRECRLDFRRHLMKGSDPAQSIEFRGTFRHAIDRTSLRILAHRPPARLTDCLHPLGSVVPHAGRRWASLGNLRRD